MPQKFDGILTFHEASSLSLFFVCIELYSSICALRYFDPTFSHTHLKNPVRILIGIALNLYLNFQRVAILKMSSHSKNVINLSFCSDLVLSPFSKIFTFLHLDPLCFEKKKKLHIYFSHFFVPFEILNKI